MSSLKTSHILVCETYSGTACARSFAFWMARSYIIMICVLGLCEVLLIAVSSINKHQANQCILPTSLDGYNITYDCNTTSGAITVSDCRPTCASGYNGQPTVACPEHRMGFTFTGCEVLNSN